MVRWSVGVCLGGSLAFLVFMTDLTTLASTTTILFSLICISLFVSLFLQPTRWVSLTLGVGLLDLLLTLATLTDRNPRDLYLWFACIPLLMLYARGITSCAAALVLVLLQTSLLRYLACPVPATTTISSLTEFRHTQLGASLSDGWLLVVLTVCAAGNCYSREGELLGQLRVALEDGARATKAKSDFLANISHELRTPMHGIMAMSGELQSMMPINTKASQALAIISDCADHLLSMVNDLLDVERIEAHQLELECTSFSIVHEIEKVTNMLRPTAEKKHLQLTTRVTVDCPQRLGDPVRFRQIAYNLLSNAIKFTPEKGTVSITLTSHSDAPVELTVSDTGIGISEQHLAHLFSCFTQVDGSVSRPYGGSGVGLAICKHLANAMDGSISVTSQLGQGSTFAVRLPLPLAEEKDKERAAPPPPPKDGADLDHTRVAEEEGGKGKGKEEDADRPACEGLEVLLVEDNIINQKVGKRMLHTLGCRVTVVANGVECVESFEKKGTTFDVILMDCQMPVMDGFQATKRIRELERKPRDAPDNGRQNAPLPIIALTASATKEYGRMCLEAGMSDVLFKPLRREVLAAALKRWAPAPTARPSTSTTTTSSTSSSSSSSSSPASTSSIASTSTSADAMPPGGLKRRANAGPAFPIVHSCPIPLHSSASYTFGAPSSSSSPSSPSPPPPSSGSAGARHRSRSLPAPIPPLRQPAAIKSLAEAMAHPARRHPVLFSRKEST